VVVVSVRTVFSQTKHSTAVVLITPAPPLHTLKNLRVWPLGPGLRRLILKKRGGMRVGVVYLVRVGGRVAEEIWPGAQVVGVVLDDSGRVRIWARGQPEGFGQLRAEDEEMYQLSAYHRAKDFLEGRSTAATYSGSWEIDAGDVVEVVGTIGAPGTRRMLPEGVGDSAAMKALLRDWLSKPAIIKF